MLHATRRILQALMDILPPKAPHARAWPIDQA